MQDGRRARNWWSALPAGLQSARPQMADQFCCTGLIGHRTRADIHSGNRFHSGPHRTWPVCPFELRSRSPSPPRHPARRRQQSHPVALRPPILLPIRPPSTAPTTAPPYCLPPGDEQPVTPAKALVALPSAKTQAKAVVAAMVDFDIRVRIVVLRHEHFPDELKLDPPA